MPFTVTHAAVVLPALPWLRGRGLPLAALVVGTMIPDAGTFLPAWIDYHVAHSPRGLVTVCLPWGVAAWLAWAYLLKAPLTDLAPAWVRRRVNGPSGPPTVAPTPGTLLTACGFVLLGAASHVLWDSFTHAGRWGVRLVPALDEPLFELPGWLPLQEYAVRGYRLGQWGSTLVLLPVTAGWAAWRLWRSPADGCDATAVPPTVRRLVRLALLAGPALAAAWEVAVRHPGNPARVTAVRAVIAAGLTLAAGTLLYAACHRLFLTGSRGDDAAVTRPAE